MLLRLADWFLAQIPIPRSLFIPIIAFFGNNDIENYEGNGDDNDEENNAFARTAAPSDFLICTLEICPSYSVYNLWKGYNQKLPIIWKYRAG